MSIQSVGGNNPVKVQIPAISKIGSHGDKAHMQDSAIKSIQTGRELHRAEMEGVKMSVGEVQLIKAIDRAIKALEGPSTTFEMKMHEATKTITVKVINKDTGEIIREIPPEKTLDLVAKMMEFAGILIDERV
ncbi:flagellar protein FlaG [Paenibacillus sp. CF384]|uniref:flagellar protein FlaG n=1 Tax=Paenibacillus sp. CF384 TaxID=1884382 RepID=UPI00089A745D|nr:flagellar protein FlaG [Paenibacillus sp. CF384]SDX28466.1 flagellar protein FlaG [Paenibacillus sp. CF384]